MPRLFAASLLPSDILALLDSEELADLVAQVESSESTVKGLSALSPAKLLFEIAKLRLPFIRMMSEIAAMLGQLEAGVKGNIRFIVLPGLASDLAMDCGLQLRGAVANALSHSFLAEHSQVIHERLSDLKKQVRSICQRVRPMPVERKDQFGKMLNQRAEMFDKFDPAKAFRDRYLADNMFTETEYEYNRTDLERLQQVSDAVVQLEKLTEKLLVASPDLSALAAGLKEGVRWASANLRQKTRSGPVSDGNPNPPRSAEDRHFTDVQRATEGLREALLAASEYADAMDDLYDFFNLQIWRQRWRIYELWVLARILLVLFGIGATVSDKSRVIDGTWKLKFTKDSSPVLGLDLNGQRIEIYYQLYQGRGATGDMPDLAVQINGDRFIAVVDPKHGYSYGRKDLNEVCERYASSFQSLFTCVCNYFPVRPAEIVRHDPLALVLYDLNPNTPTARAQFDSELINSLVLAYRNLGINLQRRVGLIVLFDASRSASRVRSVLIDALKREVAQMDIPPRTDSRALIFSTQVDRQGTLDELQSEALLEGQYKGGTDFASALRAGVAHLGALPSPTELWLFTDGESAARVQDHAGELARIGGRFVVFEAGNSALRSLAEGAGGRHVRL